jgi:NAD(P)-dependent dehydrogenase (short-subunit alcohol dehydrogenase family)
MTPELSPLATTDLAGRTALVTGGSRGVGRAIAVALAARGAAVAFTFRRDGDAAEATQRAITDAGGIARAYQASADDTESIAELVDHMRRDLGRPIDLLVSNAGSASRGRAVADTPDSEFRQLMAVHAFGPIQLIRALLPEMRAAARGDIIIISSAVTTQAPPLAAPYTMAKAAIESAARTLAREERPHGIRVNVVAPGLVATDMGARLVQASEGADLASLDASAPFGRVCRPEDVANVVGFLASSNGSYVSGQRINVDAGGPDTTIY